MTIAILCPECEAELELRFDELVCECGYWVRVARVQHAVVAGQLELEVCGPSSSELSIPSQSNVIPF